jgi:hypothetical protein
MLGRIVLIIFVWSLVGVFMLPDDTYDFLCPSSGCRNTQHIILTIMRSLISPLASAICWTGTLIYWLMTVGRE